MMRGRDAGLPSYNEYRKLCGMPVAKKFEDFHDAINEDVSIYVLNKWPSVYPSSVLN